MTTAAGRAVPEITSNTIAASYKRVGLRISKREWALPIRCSCMMPLGQCLFGAAQNFGKGVRITDQDCHSV